MDARQLFKDGPRQCIDFKYTSNLARVLVRVLFGEVNRSRYAKKGVRCLEIYSTWSTGWIELEEMLIDISTNSVCL